MTNVVCSGFMTGKDCLYVSGLWIVDEAHFDSLDVTIASPRAWHSWSSIETSMKLVDRFGVFDNPTADVVIMSK
jgi:hypothetical protein